MRDLLDSGSNTLSLVTSRNIDFSTNTAQPQQQPVIAAGHYIWLLRHNWWKIALVVIVSTLLAGFLSSRLTPIYESTARVAVDLKTPSSIVGEGAQNSGSSSEADQYFNTELQLVQSDMVLRPVAEQFNLLAGLQSKNVPQGMKASDAPVLLKNLKISHPANSFIIEVAYRSTNPIQAAQIANAVARSYIVQGREVRARASLDESAFMEKQIGELKRNMDDSAAALAEHEKALGIINAAQNTSLLTARLLQLNTQLTDAQDDRVRKEVDYKAFQTGSLAAVQVSPQALALNKLDEDLRSAQQKMQAVQTVYGSNNIEYKKAANDLTEATRQDNAMRADIGKKIEVAYVEASNRENLLRASLLEAKAQSDTLNANSTKYEELKREAETNRDLYTELFRKVKEAGINGAFQGSAVRLADPARPALRPVFPNKVIFMGLAFLFSSLVSGVVLLAMDVNDRSLRDPEQVRHFIGLELLGMLPYVTKFDQLSPLPSPKTLHSGRAKKATNQWFGTATFYQESIRSLLSTILLGRYGHPIRSIVVTSAAQGEGKSSCVGHLAAYHAMQGYRTLLIDADLRCPTQHQVFGLQNVGLTGAIEKDTPLGQVKHAVASIKNLDVIPAGDGGAGACTHLARTVKRLLEEAKHDYDMIFIDAPPILCFAEPLQLSCMADGVLVLCRAGDTSRMAVVGVLSTLSRLGATTLGLVLNQVRPEMSSSYGPYQSYYRHASRGISRFA